VKSTWTFVVSLKRSVERRERFEREAQKIGLTDWSFFDAFDGKKMGLGTSTGTSRRTTAYPSPMSPGEIGCYLSHVALWRACDLAGLSQVTIFEDDVTFDSDYFKKLETFNSVIRQSGKNIVATHFGTSAKGMPDEVQPIRGEKFIEHRGGTHCTFAYMLTRPAITWIVNHPDIDKMLWPVDGFTHELQKAFPIYGPLEPFVHQDWGLGRSELET